MILQKQAFELLDFLEKCANVVFSIKPRKCAGSAGHCTKYFSSILPSFLECEIGNTNKA